MPYCLVSVRNMHVVSHRYPRRDEHLRVHKYFFQYDLPPTYRKPRTAHVQQNEVMTRNALPAHAYNPNCSENQSPLWVMLVVNYHLT